MRDHDKGCAGFCKPRLEPSDGLDIKMVGGFVQEHDIRLFGQKPCKGCAAALPARRLGRISVKAQLKTIGQGLDPPRFAWAKRGRGKITQCGKARKIGLLFHIADRGALRACDAACVRFGQPCHDLHQGRFARPVAPNERHAIPLMHNQIQPIKNGITAKGQ